MDNIENGLGNSISSEDGFLAAVGKFCSTYWKIRGKLTHPSNKQQRLISALHMFSSHIGLTKHKQKINAQPTAVSRRQPIKTSASVPAKVGRPTLFSKKVASAAAAAASRYVMPKRIQRSKKRHNLAISLKENTKNAL